MVVQPTSAVSTNQPGPSHPLSVSSSNNTPQRQQSSPFVNSAPGPQPVFQTNQASSQRKPRPPVNLLPPDTEADDYDDSSSESSVNTNPYTADHVKKPTTLFEPPSTMDPRGSTNKTRTKKKRPNTNRRVFQPGPDSDGWATEDVTDFQGTEFDFQTNLERFDKAMVFDEIRQSDSTLPGERLVAFNKLQKPGVGGRTVGSNGQIKYGHREMVLNKSPEWDYSVRDEPLYQDDDEESVSNISAVFSLPHAPNPQARRLSRPQLQSESVEFIAASNKMPCPCASPVQMVELDRLTSDTFGISETILIENAGRGIAQLAVKSLGGTSRFAYGNHNSRPVIVLFVGNSRTGARALAAARHLANRQVRILVLAVGCIEDQQKHGGNSTAGSDEVLPEVTTQIKALESCKGKIVTRYDQFIGELNMIDSPAELVIDGFQGYQTTLDDLWEGHVETVKHCLGWANNHQKASIMSLDIPSGLDPATGLPYNKALKYIEAKWVISCGLPLTGIHNAYLTGTVAKGDWSHYVVDVGYPLGSLQRGSLRRFGQIWFGADWLLPLEVTIK